ncbi:hypothetical protein QOT17_007754 [Balamuthia mandrillaris]
MENYITGVLKTRDTIEAIQRGKLGIAGPNRDCACECQVNGPSDLHPLSTVGYGKYCGAGYTCGSDEPGCDPVDNCCRIHDLCIAASDYCIYGCKCNVEMLRCLSQIRGAGFPPCHKQMFARKVIRADACYASKYGHRSCAGCGDQFEEELSSYCAEF